MSIRISCFCIILPVLFMNCCGQTVKIEDFCGLWYSEYIHDPENADDNLINYSFELFLETDNIVISKISNVFDYKTKC